MPSGSVSSYLGADDIHSFQNTTVIGRNYLAFGRTVHIPGAPSMPQTGSYSAEFSFGSEVNAFGFDEVAWGASVPSPSAASLLALGGLIASRRRR